MFEFLGFQISWKELLDISLVAVVYFYVILLVRGTRAAAVIWGLLLLLLVYYISDVFGLYTLNWLLTNFLSSIFLVIIVLFQRDIRKGLAQMGAGRLWRKKDFEIAVIDEICSAMDSMARQKIGALVVIQKNVPLGDIIEKGVEVNGRVSKQLLINIFWPDTPLHDGAVVINSSSIVAASCILPLAQVSTRQSAIGTRHRAALGISEETDAIALVVSEERGTISAAIGGKLTTSLDIVRLKRVLKNILK
ncbi:diadenylate cyclase CdaA [Maridesulfovibrio hydrothermalis]|uniref:Diadenylate cyclase n=1 Tax=Maridesulfovibrio hydrothermalis AM13 = DSM 14728 TaxID=1121451 RepID=L0RFY3_9BACT|nr:diadenylate cyclase CdaA [Maridesulfovibrio hydrothermalis]CCO24456.1 putative enzyme with DAC domain protein [Maridesulfovibrio hydrothermalis AM13 = DSM 14728]